MSMYDTVDLDPAVVPTVDVDGTMVSPPATDWQTKDLDEAMDSYRITASGQLEIQRGEWVEPPVTPARRFRRGLGDLGHWEPTGWEPVAVSADLRISQYWRDDDARHPQFPTARRWWSLTANMTLVDGRLSRPITAEVPEAHWSEPVGDGWMRLETDPQRRAELAERERWNAATRRVGNLRHTPEVRLRRLLAQHLPPSALHQAHRLLRSALHPQSRGNR